MYFKKFPFAVQTIFSLHNLEADNFFSQLQLANNFFLKKVTPFRRLLFLGRLLSGGKMTPAVRELFEIRADSYFDTNIVSNPSICEALHKYDFSNHFDSWYHHSSLQIYASWKTVKCKIWEFQHNSWNFFVFDHPNLSLAQACSATMSPHMFGSISDQYPYLACRLHVQIRLMGNFGLNGIIPWITNTDDALCFVCKRDTEILSHLLLTVLTSESTLTHFGQTCALKSLLAILWLADIL